MSSISDLITRNYNNFRGVDFTNNDVKVNRSPETVNMWKKYDDSDCVQTRPGINLLTTFENKILGLFYKIV